MRPCNWSITLARLGLAAALLLPARPPAGAQQVQMMSPDQAELIRGLMPTVVNISSFVADTSAGTAANASAPATNQVSAHPKTMQGSGFVIDPGGVILTNYHVIDDAYDIRVRFSDGTRAPGRVFAAAPRVDLALVKVDVQHPLSAVHWADSDKVQVGDPVFAIGNPLGVGLSVTSGIVSALNRNIMDTPYDDFIQTDAAINHGNSGGPLFDARGEVIGVDTAIVSPTTASAGLGFAIPANDARFVADRLLLGTSHRAAYLGAKLEQVTPDMAAALGLSRPMGSIVARVRDGGPAAAAGLRVGDVVLRYDNQAPADNRALMRAIARSTIAQAVSLIVLRAGREQTLQVTLTEWPGTVAAVGAASGEVPGPAFQVPPDLGLILSALNAVSRSHYGLQMEQTGVLVDGVAFGTDAFDRGLQPGDVILRVQDTDVSSPQQVQAAVDAARSQHKEFILTLVLPKEQQSLGPRWVALRIVAP
jgi:serine protease Do